MYHHPQMQQHIQMQQHMQMQQHIQMQQHLQMQHHPQWQNNQWGQLPQQQHRGPSPLMQLNLVGQHESFNQFHRQPEYKLNPNWAPGIGRGHRQVPYGPNTQRNRIQSFPPNMGRNDHQRKFLDTKHNDKSSWGNKIFRSLKTETKSKDKRNTTDNESNPKQMKDKPETTSNNKSSPAGKDSSSEKKIDIIQPIINSDVIESSSNILDDVFHDTMNDIDSSNNNDEVNFDGSNRPRIQTDCSDTSSEGSNDLYQDSLQNLKEISIINNSIDSPTGNTVNSFINIEKDEIVPSIEECPTDTTSSKHNESGISYRIVSSIEKNMDLDEEVDSNHNDLAEHDISCMNISISSDKTEDDDSTEVINEEMRRNTDNSKEILQTKNDYTTKSGRSDEQINSRQIQLETNYEENSPTKKIKESKEPIRDDVFHDTMNDIDFTNTNDEVNFDGSNRPRIQTDCSETSSEGSNDLYQDSLQNLKEISIINDIIDSPNGNTVNSFIKHEKDEFVPSIEECPTNTTSSKHNESGISYRIVSSKVKNMDLDKEVDSNINDLGEHDISCMNISISSDKTEDEDSTEVINEEMRRNTDNSKEILQTKNNCTTNKSGRSDEKMNSRKRKLETNNEENSPTKKIKEYEEPTRGNINGKLTSISEVQPLYRIITQQEVTDYCPKGHSLRNCYSTVNVITDVISVFCKRCKIMIRMG